MAFKMNFHTTLSHEEFYSKINGNCDRYVDSFFYLYGKRNSRTHEFVCKKGSNYLLIGLNPATTALFLVNVFSSFFPLIKIKEYQKTSTKMSRLSFSISYSFRVIIPQILFLLFTMLQFVFDEKIVLFDSIFILVVLNAPFLIFGGLLIPFFLRKYRLFFESL